MRRITGITVALLVALGAAGPAEAREQSRKCYPKRGAEGIKTGTRARVFSTQDPGDGAELIYACDLLTGRRTLIEDAAFDEGLSVDKVRMAGRLVAFQEVECSGRTAIPDPDPCDGVVATLDVQKRERRDVAVEGAVEDIVLLPNGAMAWMERLQTGEWKVRALPPSDPATELDSGPSIVAGSLALARDGRVYWRNGGEPRSAQLAGEPLAESRYSDPEPRGRSACFPSRSATLAASRRIRLYERLSADGDTLTYLLCDLRTGRRTKIISVFDEPNQSFAIRHAHLAGTRAAFAGQECFKFGCAAPKVHVVDVTGAAKPRAVASGGYVYDVVLRPDGAVAWIAGETPMDPVSPARPRELRLCDADGCATLETGADIGPASLALSSGSGLYWTRSGEARTAP
jgi:hypothetical protein